MKKAVIVAFAFLLGLVAVAQDAQNVHDTKYDWSGLSNGICAGKSTPYDKFYAIYRWLCDNIAYDTSYTIYDADQCYETKRGVCQAYSELFYYLAKAQGLKVDIVSGKSKSDDGISDEGHAWVMAYTEPTTAMLIDPTWGAGSVNNGVFKRNKHDDSWFNVHPAWMIFSHFPENEIHQLLPTKLTYAQFAAIPNLRPYMRKFGYSGSELLASALKGDKLDLPELYNLEEVEGVGIPHAKNLEVGNYYTMQVKTKLPASHLGFLGEAANGSLGEWQQQGDVAVGRVLVARPGELTLGIKKKSGENTYSTIAAFNVPKPTAQQLARLEQADPMSSTYWDDVENADYTTFRKLPIDFGKVLAQLKSQNIKIIPIFYSGAKYSVGNIPWNGKMKVGETYTIEFIPCEGVGAAVINEGDWYEEWTQPDPNGPWVITVTPQKKGKLKVSIQLAAESSYTSCFAYEVE